MTDARSEFQTDGIAHPKERFARSWAAERTVGRAVA